MIKIKSVTGRKTECKIKGTRFDTANEAINVAVSLVKAFMRADAVIGDTVRTAIIAELEKLAPGHDGYKAEIVSIDELNKREE